MSTPNKFVWIVAGVLFALASIAIQYQVKYAMHQHGGGTVQVMGNLKIGQPAPDFTLADVAGHNVTLNSFRGHSVVLLDFWATWCGPCRMAMPDLQQIADDLKGRPFEILSVNQGETAEAAGNFMTRKKYTFHVVLDSQQAVGASYGVKGIPTLVVVDKKGIVQWLQVGYAGDDNALHTLVEKLTKE